MSTEVSTTTICGYTPIAYKRNFRYQKVALPRINLTKLDTSGFVDDSIRMHNIKISSKVDEAVWNELKALAKERHQNVSGLLTEAIREYVKRKRVRPEVMNHLEASMDENEELGKRLAR